MGLPPLDPSHITWQLKSEAPEDADLEQHLEDLGGRLPDLNALRGNVPNEWAVTLDIAAMYDTFTYSLTVPARWLSHFLGFITEVELSTYPTDFSLD